LRTVTQIFIHILSDATLWHIYCSEYLRRQLLMTVANFSWCDFFLRFHLSVGVGARVVCLSGDN